MRNSVATGFAPWIVFWAVSSPSTWKWAAIAALLVSLALVVPQLERRRGVAALDITSIVFFAVLSVLALVLQRSTLAVLEDYAQAISMAVLALVALGGVLVGRPFTAHYAQQDVPQEFWGTPQFRRVNRVLTLMWAAAFAVIAVAGFVAVRYLVAPDLLQWVVPIVVIIAAARFTASYTADDDPPREATSADGGSVLSGGPGSAS